MQPRPQGPQLLHSPRSPLSPQPSLSRSRAGEATGTPASSGACCSTAAPCVPGALALGSSHGGKKASTGLAGDGRPQQAFAMAAVPAELEAHCSVPQPQPHGRLMLPSSPSHPPPIMPSARLLGTSSSS